MKATKNLNNSLNVTEHTFQLELDFVELHTIKRAIKKYLSIDNNSQRELINAESDEQLLKLLKRTTSHDSDLRYLISLRSKELHETV